MAKVARHVASGQAWHSVIHMSITAWSRQHLQAVAAWCRRHSVAAAIITAVFFALLDTVATLAGSSWWPAHPGPLAWAMLALQALADLTLVARRRAPLLVMAVLTGYTLAITLLISPAHALTPVTSGNIWAPFGTVLAAYSPFYYSKDRRITVISVAILTAIVARIWEPAAGVVAVGILRTAVGPLLALYFGARNCMIQALTDRAERAERERDLLAEQARAEERARLAGEMHDVVTHRVSLMVLQAGALGITAPDQRDPAGGGRAAGSRLPGAGRTPGSGRHPAGRTRS